MLDRIEILVEEPSVAEVLRGLLPSVLHEGWLLDENCFIRPHEGKQALQQSLPRKISSMGKKDIRVGIMVLQDQDSSDCVELKQKLISLCNSSMPRNSSVPYKVRIVCHELEAWYMGDLDALEMTFPRFHAQKYRNRALFRNPDACLNPKRELKKILGDYPQIATAREMALHMNVERNRSASFRCFFDGLAQMTADDNR